MVQPASLLMAAATLAAAVGALLLVGLAGTAPDAPPPDLLLDMDGQPLTADALPGPAQSVLATWHGEEVIVVRLPSAGGLPLEDSVDSLVAFDAHSTYMGCQLQLDVKWTPPSAGTLVLRDPCHYGEWSPQDGRILEEPAPEPLPRYWLDWYPGEGGWLTVVASS